MSKDNKTVAKTTKKQLGGVTGKGFMPGVSGNPNGRPEGSVSIVEGIKRKLMEIEPINKKTYLDLLLNTYFKNAIKDGDTGLIRDMINRVDGMPLQKQEFTGDTGIKVNIVDYGTDNKPTTQTEGSPKES